MVKRNVKKTLKKRIKNKFTRKRSRRVQKGGSQVDEITAKDLKKKYFFFVKKFIDTHSKKQNLKSIIEKLNYSLKNKYSGVVYDFIFKEKYPKKKDLDNVIIWNHGKPNSKEFEPITAGKPGLHVYVYIKKDNYIGIKLLDIIFTPPSSQTTY